MPTATPREFEKSLAASVRPPRIVLLHGGNEDLKADLFKLVCRSADVSPDDAFRFVRLEQNNLDLESGRLADELGSISMFGGLRLVHVRATTRQCEQAVRQALQVPGEWLLLVEAPDLNDADWFPEIPRKSEVLAVCCKEESAGDFRGFVEREVSAAGLSADQEAIDRMIFLVGDDRTAIRAELIKLAALVGARRTIALEDVNAAVADASAMLADEIAEAAMAGDSAVLANSLERLSTTGADAVQALMAAHRLALTLHRNRTRQWSTSRNENHAPAWTSGQLRFLVKSLGQSVRQTRADSANSSLIAERALTALGYAANNRKR